MHVFALLSPVIFILVVTILGFVTPGYNHLNHTISRLAIEKYGWVQTINFLQLAVGCLLIGKQIATTMKKAESRRIIRVFFSFSASILILATLAPTDRIDDLRFQLSLLTPLGSVHAGSVLIFILVSPMVITRLVRAIQNESNYRQFTATTAIAGSVAFTASVVWVVFFSFGIFLEYRGIFQKLITLLTLSWVMLMNMWAMRSTNAS